MPDNPRQRSDVLFPEIDPYATGRLKVDALHTLYWEACGNHGRRAARVPARRSGRRLPAASSPLFRPGVLAHRALRPARRGALDAVRRARRQHDAASRRRPRAAAPASRHRALAALRRLVGLDAGARLCRGASGALPRARAARDLPRAAVRARLVHARHALRVSGSLARVLANSCRRPSATTCSRNYYRRLAHADPAVHMPAAQAWDRYEGACSKLLPTDPLPSVRKRRLGARDRAHRGPLFRPPRRSSSPISSSRTSGASGTCRARSSRDATTSSARR